MQRDSTMARGTTLIIKILKLLKLTLGNPISVTIAARLYVYYSKIKLNYISGKNIRLP
jgi:hypothetical protein